MLTVEGLSRIEVADPKGDLVFAGGGDIENAFHHLLIDESLGRLFCTPALSAKDAGVVGSVVDGKVLKPFDVVQPYPRSLPMGFLWSLLFCHDATEQQFRLADVPCSLPLLTDRGPLLVLARVPDHHDGQSSGGRYT